MKIIDSFIFCADYEKELLLLKLILEDPVIDEFIGIECCYTYRGDFKGPILYDMINGDSRFDPYRAKLTIMTVKDNLSGVASHSLDNQIDPNNYAQAEWNLRDVSQQYLINKYQPDDWVLTTDVDEMFDFSNEQRKQIILEQLRSSCEPLQFERIRYIYDFDNRAYRSLGDIVCPAYKIKHLQDGTARLRDKKWIGKLISVNESFPTIFEYCFCFPIEGIYYKYNSSLHTKWSKDKIDQSLRCNHWGMADYQTADPNNKWQWFEKVKLTEHNSPEYVRVNIDKLRTGLVPDNYKENRVQEYGKDPKFS